MKDHLVLIVPEQHPFARRGKVSFAEVLNEPFVGLSPGNALQDHIDDHARAAGQPLDLRIRMKTFDALCEMVSHSIGVGILPQRIAKCHRGRHTYRTLPLTDDWARRQLCLCFRAWEELSTPMQSLLVHLGEKMDTF